MTVAARLPLVVKLPAVVAGFAGLSFGLGVFAAGPGASLPAGLAAAGGLSVAAAGLAAYFLARRYAARLARYAGAAERLAKGDADVRLGLAARGDEFGTVAKKFSKLRDATRASNEARRVGTFKGSAFDGSSVAMMMIDRDFDITYVNEATKALFTRHADVFKSHYPDLDIDQPVGINIDVFHDNPGHQRRLLSNPANLPHRTDIELGDLRIALNVSGIFDEQGAYVGNVLEWDDVTQQRTNAGMLDAIDRSQARIEFTLDGVVVDANENFLNLMGYGLDEIVGEHHRLFVESDFSTTEEYKTFWSRLARGEFIAGKYKRRSKAGDDIWIYGVYAPIFDRAGKPFRVVKIATDITEQENKTQEAVFKSAAFEGSSIATMMIDRDFIITDVNQATRELLSHHEETFQTLWSGFSADSILGVCIDKFHKNPAHQRKMLADPGNLPFVTDITIGDFKFSLRIAAVYDENNAYVGNLLQWEDVSDIRTNAGILKAIDEAQAVIEFKPDGEIVKANPNFLSFMGYSEGQIVGRHHRMFCDERNAASAEYAEFWRQLASGEAKSGIFKQLTATGDEVWIQAIYTPITDATGNVFKVVKFATDVTATEKEVNENRSKIDAIGRSQAVIEFDTQGKVLKANENFFATMGYSESEVVGKHHSMFLAAEDAQSADYQALWDGLRAGQFKEGTFKRVGKGGKPVFLSATYQPLRDLNGDIDKIVKFASDVTDLEEAKQKARVERERRAAELSQVVDALAASLARVADGDLLANIDMTFAEEYEALRVDFNAALDKLREAMKAINANAVGIQNNAGEISLAADDLSKRTENQAATLEETAASIDEITSTVKQTADGALQANASMEETRTDAEASGEVVRNAIDAMNAIERSSEQITQIIGVIDEIAFQTNLLALNAGVEAARAGDAGRGFAVVASEVRALAQRSSDAAKEIKDLISASSEHVGRGVELVGDAGGALEKIVVRIADVATIVAEISSAAQEQATSLSEINTAVNQMDQVTQQNAAMVEESTAASHSMKREANELVRSVSRFKIGADASGAAPATSAPRAPAAPNVHEQRARAAKFAGAQNGSAALSVDHEPEDNWEEF
ncbi:MAG: methyl-accepting chemotaxis protein [Pseudomonadota bacterium]